MRPRASMTMMPSTAESMTARHRASLARKLLFELARVGEVVQHAGELALAADEHLAHRQVEREHRAVLAPARDLAADADDRGLAGGQVAMQVAVVLLVIRRRHQHADVAAEDFRFRIAEQSFAPPG